MRIIQNRLVVENDWRLAADDGPLPEGRVIVSLSRWLSQREELNRHTGTIGVRLGPDDLVEALAPDALAVAVQWNGEAGGLGQIVWVNVQLELNTIRKVLARFITDHVTTGYQK